MPTDAKTGMLVSAGVFGMAGLAAYCTPEQHNAGFFAEKPFANEDSKRVVLLTKRQQIAHADSCVVALPCVFVRSRAHMCVD